jgi:hypothetical protein
VSDLKFANDLKFDDVQKLLLKRVTTEKFEKVLEQAMTKERAACNDRIKELQI